MYRQSLKINVKSLEWWFWAITLIAMIVGLKGMIEGFYAVISISFVQFIYFIAKSGLVAFPTQVRVVYLLLVVIALFDPTRLLYWLLLVGTVMVTFFDRCFIARALARMPWNAGVSLT